MASLFQIKQDWRVTRSRQRLHEYRTLFARVPDQSLGRGLEIGAGDGFLATQLVAKCTSLVTTDSAEERLAGSQGDNPKVCCDARCMPFDDASFDFIFSSSVLEHIPERERAYCEMSRCLAPNGTMVHIMPSVAWKTLQLLLYYPNLLASGIDLLSKKLAGVREQTSSERWSDRPRRIGLKDAVRGVLPGVHGEFKNHLEEYRGFRARSWIAEFERAGLRTIAIVRLPPYSGYGFGLDGPRGRLERLGLSSHNAFIVSRRDGASQHAAFFGAPPAHPCASLT